MRSIVPAIFLVFLFQLSLIGPAFGFTIPERLLPAKIWVTTAVNQVSPNTVASVTALPDLSEGPFLDPINVSLKTTTQGATVHYTLDGTAPTTSSPVYSNFIVVDGNTTVKAFAVKAGMDDSPVTTVEYVIQRVAFYSFEFVELKGRSGHKGFFPISGQPVVGTTLNVTAQLLGKAKTANFRLVTPTGQTIQALNLTMATRRKYFGPIQVPKGPFQVAVSGLDDEGEPYDYTLPKTFNAQTVDVNVISPAKFIPGVTTLKAAVTNHGGADTFTVTATDNQGFITRVAPKSLVVGTGKTEEFEVDVTIPSNTAEFTLVDFTLQVTSATNSQITNSASENHFVFLPPTITLPPDITVLSTGPLTLVDIGTATATDNSGIHSITNDAPEAGFPVGTTLVKWTAMDTSGFKTSAIQTITVTPP